jgi:putative CocE/NonD family hydrolase
MNESRWVLKLPAEYDAKRPDRGAMETLTEAPAAEGGGQPDTSRFNGLQTTGRVYRNLSAAEHRMGREVDEHVPLRDGAHLRCDVYRPAEGGRFPVLIAASPYPRQIQDLGAPTAIIEAGNSEFFVSRGYVHVIASLRGTGGSDGEWGMFDEQERRDLYDLVEWAAEQSWSDGNVGMIGISYFAIAQVGAAVTRPPHLKAIFPFEVTSDLYEAAYHYGLFSSSFMTPWLTMIGVTAPHSSKLWRGHVANAARRVLSEPRVHERVGHINGESAKSVLKLIMKAPYDSHPWDDLWRAVAVDHQTRDAFWDQRNALVDLETVDIPVYIGCDWDNVPMHLPGTFSTWRSLANNARARMALLPSGATSWPWESMHVEALAWFDLHLKDRDTGIDDGPPIRYWLPVAEQWRTADRWPPRATHHELGLGADGRLHPRPAAGSRDYLCLGTGLQRPARAAKSDPPGILRWESDPLTEDLDIAGEIELRLTATSTATDTAWIIVLSDVAPDGTATPVTGGWQRASLRSIDLATSRPGAPAIPCRDPQPVPIGRRVDYRIPLVPNARRFATGHRIQLTITSDDQPADIPVFLDYRHAPVGTSARNTVHSNSQLLLPVITTESAQAPAV